MSRMQTNEVRILGCEVCGGSGISISNFKSPPDYLKV